MTSITIDSPSGSENKAGAQESGGALGAEGVQTARPSDQARGLGGPVLMTVGLAVAFSPVLVDLAQHFLIHPRVRTALVFPFFALAVMRAKRGNLDSPRGLTPGSGRRLIWWTLLIGLSIEILAVAGGVVRLGRVGLVLAVVGAVFGSGWARLAVASLFVWAIPVPRVLVALASPGLETQLLRVTESLVPGVATVELGGVLALQSGHLQLAIDKLDGGLPLVIGMLGIACGMLCLRPASIPASMRLILVSAGIGFAAQLVILISAAGLLAMGVSSAARGVLHQAPLVVLACCAAIALVRTPSAANSGPVARSERAFLC